MGGKVLINYWLSEGKQTICQKSLNFFFKKSWHVAQISAKMPSTTFSFREKPITNYWVCFFCFCESKWIPRITMCIIGSLKSSMLDKNLKQNEKIRIFAKFWSKTHFLIHLKLLKVLRSRVLIKSWLSGGKQTICPKPFNFFFWKSWNIPQMSAKITDTTFSFKKKTITND